MVRKFIAFAGMDPADKDDAERLRAAVIGHETQAAAKVAYLAYAARRQQIAKGSRRHSGCGR